MKRKSIFTCSICMSRNYDYYLSSNREESLKLNKYCSLCKRTTEHKESI